MSILEIGSREVTGPSQARKEFSQSEYIGFDYYPGDNFDIVGDAHNLSSYFCEGKRFDIIYSRACFEHFAMPWIVAVEISKLLKVGGLVLSKHISPGHLMRDRGTSFNSAIWPYEFSFPRHWDSNALRLVCQIRWLADSRRWRTAI